MWDLGPTPMKFRTGITGPSTEEASKLTLVGLSIWQSLLPAQPLRDTLLYKYSRMLEKQSLGNITNLYFWKSGIWICCGHLVSVLALMLELRY